MVSLLTTLTYIRDNYTQINNSITGHAANTETRKNPIY